MFAIIVLAIAALVALMVFGFVIHVLFSPWLSRRHRGLGQVPAGPRPPVAG